MTEREELEALRRLAELEAKAGGERWKSSADAVGAPPGPALNTEALVDTVKDMPRLAGQGVMQTVQGAMDLPVGAAQLVSKVIPGTTVEDAVSEYMRKREKAYAPYTGAEERPGQIQPGRIGGNVAAGVALSPDKTPAGLFGRMKSGAKVGGTMGLLTPVHPDNSSFWGTKGVQVGVGTGMGFAAPPIVEGLVRGASAAANWIAGKLKGAGNVATGAIRPAEVESTLTIELQKNGVDFAQLSKEMREQLVGEVQSALKSGGTLDQAAVKRLADFTKLDMKPMQGQVSRDPYQWGNERNLGKMEVGRPVAERLTEQNNQMIGVLDRTRSGTSGSADTYAAGEKAIDTLKTVGQGQKKVVDAAYDQARDHLGRAAPMDAATFSREANLALDEGMLGHYLPAEVRGILNDVTAGKVPLNVNTAVQIDSTLSAAQRAAGNGTPQALAIGKVRDALNKAPIADNVGESAKAAFDAARSTASARFGNLERTPALADVMGGERLAPEKFIEQYFVRGDVNSVNSVMKQMPPEGRAEVQAGILDWIRQRAVLGEGDTATLSAAGLKRALDTIGDRKLSTVFDAQQLDQLRTLARVSAYIDRAPKSSSANFSGSGTMIADALDKMSRLPVVGALIGKPGDFIRATQVARAVGGAAPVREAAPVISGELVDAVAPRAGLLGAPTAGSLPSAFFAPNQKVKRNDERRY